jgi:hypothetical protein
MRTQKLYEQKLYKPKKPYEHGGIRTPDIQNRNLTLYPAELHAHRRENTRRRSPAEIGFATHLLA